jgi:hypothetical protein
LEEDDGSSGDETLVGDTDSKASSTSSEKSKSKLTRIIMRNMTKQQAVMINGPIGEDIWTHISHLEIKDNTAEGDSMMINHATTPDMFFRLMDLRAKQLDATTKYQRPRLQGGIRVKG